MRDARHEVDRVLGELGTLVGVQIELDETGQAVLEFADDIVCTIAVPDQAGYVLLEATVARLPAAGREAILAAALRRNRFGLEVAGACIALDEAGEELLLCCSVPATREDIHTLPDTLAALIAQAGELRGLVQAATPVDGPSPGVGDMYSSTVLFRG